MNLYDNIRLIWSFLFLQVSIVSKGSLTVSAGRHGVCWWQLGVKWPSSTCNRIKSTGVGVRNRVLQGGRLVLSMQTQGVDFPGHESPTSTGDVRHSWKKMPDFDLFWQRFLSYWVGWQFRTGNTYDRMILELDSTFGLSWGILGSPFL